MTEVESVGRGEYVVLATIGYWIWVGEEVGDLGR